MNIFDFRIMGFAVGVGAYGIAAAFERATVPDALAGALPARPARRAKR